jgi:hypothetical protein
MKENFIAFFRYRDDVKLFRSYSPIQACCGVQVALFADRQTIALRTLGDDEKGTQCLEI